MNTACNACSSRSTWPWRAGSARRTRSAWREFRDKAHDNLAIDHAGELVYLAPTRVNLGLTEERWPEIKFLKTRENLAA